MKRFFISLFVIFFALALVNSPTRAKAASLSENETIRLGIAGLGYGLEHFGYVLPSPNQIEALGGFSEYAKIVGQRISEADPFDDWYADNEILNELFAPITFGRDLGYILASLFNEEGFYSLFGFEVSEESYDTSDFSTGWNQFLEIALSSGENAFVLVREYDDIGGKYFVSRTSSSVFSINFTGNNITTPTGFWYPYNSSPFFDYPNYSTFTCIYVGAVPLIIGNRASQVTINFVQYGVSSEAVTFEPSLSPYSGSYEIDIGDSFYYPSVFYNNYGTIYNNLQTDNFYDAVNLIINDPDDPDSGNPPSIKPINPPSGPSLGGTDFNLGQPLFVKPYLQQFFTESYDFIVFVHDSIWASGIDYVFYAILICGIMGGIISKILH